MTTCNAVIKSARLFIEDHGLLTTHIDLDYGDGSGQGFGSYAYYSSAWKSPGPNKLALFVWRVLGVAGVDAWDRLPGRTVRARIDNGLVVAVGHIVRDDWFTPRESFDKMTGD